MNEDKRDYIITHIRDIIDMCKEDKTRQDILNKYTEFYQNYPALVNMIMNDPYNFDFKRVLEMLNIRDNVEKKTLSYEDASLYVGHKYYNEFVKDKVDSKKEKKKNKKKNKN